MYTIIKIFPQACFHCPRVRGAPVRGDVKGITAVRPSPWEVCLHLKYSE